MNSCGKQFTDSRRIGEHAICIKNCVTTSDSTFPRNTISFFLTIAAIVAPRAKRRPVSYATMLRHLGGLGVFLVAIVDSSPLPTFGGTDILTAVLAARHVEPWYYYATLATVGSVIGAYLTFRAARLAGSNYLQKKFGKRRVATFLDYFEQWGTAGLAVSTAAPFPFPTSAFFAAAGVLKYSRRKFLLVVSVCRGARYAVIAIVAFHYGRHFIRVLRHPRTVRWLVLSDRPCGDGVGRNCNPGASALTTGKLGCRLAIARPQSIFEVRIQRKQLLKITVPPLWVQAIE